MSNLLRVSNEVLYFKTESSYGVDSTPTTSDAILTKGRVTMVPEGDRVNAREAVRASLGELQDVVLPGLKRISFECEVKGSGTAGTAPELGPLLEACGFEETLVALTSATYTPESSSHESGTMYWFEGGRKRYILTGCRGKVRFYLSAGGLLMAAFEFLGHFAGPTDQSIPSPSYDSAVPRAAAGMAVTVNSVTDIVVRSWEWAVDGEVSAGDSVSAADSYGEVAILSRRIMGKMQLQADLSSVIDFDALKAAGTRFAWASGTLGSVAGNRVQITTPASSTYVLDTRASESNGLALREVDLKIDDSTPNQELSVAFT